MTGGMRAPGARRAGGGPGRSAAGQTNRKGRLAPEGFDLRGKLLPAPESTGSFRSAVQGRIREFSVGFLRRAVSLESRVSNVSPQWRRFRPLASRTPGELSIP